MRGFGDFLGGRRFSGDTGGGNSASVPDEALSRDIGEPVIKVPEELTRSKIIRLQKMKAVNGSGVQAGEIVVGSTFAPIEMRQRLRIQREGRGQEPLDLSEVMGIFKKDDGTYRIKTAGGEYLLDPSQSVDIEDITMPKAGVEASKEITEIISFGKDDNVVVSKVSDKSLTSDGDMAGFIAAKGYDVKLAMSIQVGGMILGNEVLGDKDAEPLLFRSSEVTKIIRLKEGNNSYIVETGNSVYIVRKKD